MNHPWVEEVHVFFRKSSKSPITPTIAVDSRDARSVQGLVWPWSSKYSVRVINYCTITFTLYRSPMNKIVKVRSVLKGAGDVD